ncbi:hypothetical protein [Hwangdonia lutea]|uniref:Uncharacterized protein n=1 Tax=Hwangdonia lutea TaxID=3075823 RepID=A0AA97ENJ8_9FLAO|nr:hypothetical protein [Hwangdonia sp. SCSIO 19198]WOD43715.1 hypothetical protein RNZ46_00265 [Hwangdonia sp. SCSIO 19198]
MNFYEKSLSNFNENYILYIPLSIIFQSCVGSIAAMYILINSTISEFYLLELTICVIVSMTYNAAIMAHLKLKWTFNLLILSLIVNIILIALNVMRLQ